MAKTPGLLATAGFVAWSAVHVAGTIWHVLAPDTRLSASVVMSDSAFLSGQQTSPAQIIDLERIKSVFVLRSTGQVSMASVTANEAVAATETRLALSLKGAVASSDPSRARAIIASADVQEIYQAGDNLRDTPGTVVLQEIHLTYVLLDNNGQIETLRMDDPELSIPAAAPATGAATVSDNSPSIDTSITLPAGISANSALTDVVRIQPVFESADSDRAGALRGLQIRHGSRQDFLAAVGLQQGDLITAVDGSQLDDAGELPALMDRLSSQQVVSLQVLRDQSLITVELDRRRW